MTPNSPTHVGTPVDKDSGPAQIATPLPEIAPKPWYAYESKPQIPYTAISSPIPDSTGKLFVPDQLVPVGLVEKKRLTLRWKFQLVAGRKALTTGNGHEEFDLFDRPEQARPFLRLCDARLEELVEQPLIAAVRARFLNKLELEAAPAEIALKTTWEITLSTPFGLAHETKGSAKAVIKLDPKTIRGQIGLVEISWRQDIFNPAKANFRSVAIGLLEGLDLDESTELTARSIQQELKSLLQPDMAADDQLPPVLHEIEIADI